MDEHRQPVSLHVPPTVWIIDSHHVLSQASVAAARQLGIIAVPVESAAQGLGWLNHNDCLIPDLILFDDAPGSMSPAHFATALMKCLGDLAPPVIYIVGSRESADALTSLKPGLDVILQRPVAARGVFTAVLSGLARSAEEGSLLHAHGLELDMVRQTLGYQGRNTNLTRFECGFMEHVMRRRDRMVTNDELLEHVWGSAPGTGTPEVLRAHVRNLRRKLQLLGAPRDVIWTVQGRGYRLREASS